jgi:hypothetical protein
MQSIEFGVQPPSAPPDPVLVVVSAMPLLDEAGPCDVLPPVAPLAAPVFVPDAVDVEVDVAPVPPLPLLRLAVALHAENAPNSTKNPHTRPARVAT